MIQLQRLLRLAILVTLASVMAGCASAPGQSESLFLLQQPDSASAEQTTPTNQRTKRVNLLVAAVDMAPYLTHDGIVYQAGPNRIVIAGNNRWAAPLAAQISTGLYRTLSRGLNNVNVRQAGEAHAHKPDYRLQVNIDQFQGRYDGKAIISGRWQLLNTDHETIERKAFEQTVPLNADGYTELVRALSRGWQQVEARLQDNIRQAMRQQTGQ